MTLPINLFDLLLVAVLAAGVLYGRKRGISVELLASAKWLALLLGCAALYRPAGVLVAQAAGLSLLTAYLLAYLGTALLILLVFSMIQRRVAPKLVGTDAFGRGEYYLGMASGMIQFGCMLLMSLALLNAREFTPAELKALEQYEEAAYGSSVFPNLHSFQAAVFERSLFGPWIQQDLDFLLISPTEIEQMEPRRQPAAATAKR
jgi:colicin V production protein